MTGSVDISALQNGQIITTASGSGTLDSFVIGSITPKAATFTSADTTGANTWSKSQRGAFVALTYGATITPDFSLSDNYSLIMTGNGTLGVPTNLGAGQTGQINIWQDITGSRTLAYAWPYSGSFSTLPTLSTGKLVMDKLTFSVDNYATATITMTIATPGVVTWTGHGLNSGMKVQFTTTGALPTGVSASTSYWVTVIDANTFKLSTTLANAQAGTFVNTSGSQSGVQTAVNALITISSVLAVG